MYQFWPTDRHWNQQTNLLITDHHIDLSMDEAEEFPNTDTHPWHGPMATALSDNPQCSVWSFCGWSEPNYINLYIYMDRSCLPCAFYNPSACLGWCLIVILNVKAGQLTYSLCVVYLLCKTKLNSAIDPHISSPWDHVMYGFYFYGYSSTLELHTPIGCYRGSSIMCRDWQTGAKWRQTLAVIYSQTSLQSAINWRSSTWQPVRCYVWNICNKKPRNTCFFSIHSCFYGFKVHNGNWIILALLLTVNIGKIYFWECRHPYSDRLLFI